MSELNQFSYQQTHDRKLVESICVAATVKVLAFDKEKMTVNVQPLSKHLEHGKYESQPPILCVPVMCIKTGGFIMRPWINEDDVGLVVYLDHDLDSTVSGGDEAEPLTERSHATSDAIFIGGIVSGDYSVPDEIPDEAHVITNEDGTIYVAVTSEEITIKNGDAINVTVTDEKVTVENDDTTMDINSDSINLKTQDFTVEASGDVNIKADGDFNVKTGGKAYFN